MEGPGGRDGLLDIFDKLGVVMHFAKLPFLTDYVLEPALAYLWRLFHHVFGRGEGCKGTASAKPTLWPS